jgi:hypothetical protein
MTYDPPRLHPDCNRNAGQRTYFRAERDLSGPGATRLEPGPDAIAGARSFARTRPVVAKARRISVPDACAGIDLQHPRLPAEYAQ